VVLTQSQSGNKSAFKGKVTPKEYDETVTKKMEEFREMNQGRAVEKAACKFVMEIKTYYYIYTPN
jgi:peroxiredoxin family protein